jgi:hypothetical protein
MTSQRVAKCNVRLAIIHNGVARCQGRRCCGRRRAWMAERPGFNSWRHRRPTRVHDRDVDPFDQPIQDDGGRA